MDDADGEEIDGSGRPGSNGGGKLRSGTSYPYYGLSTAIRVVEAVRRAGGSEAPNADVMRELGVKKAADRPWSYGIPSTAQFGLIERVGRGDDGRIRLTGLAERIVLPQDDEEKRKAKVEAFMQPAIYAALAERFAGHPVPPKDGLKNIMYRDFKILESMAPNAAEAFLESLKEAELITVQNTVASPHGSLSTKSTLPKDDIERETPAEAGFQTIKVPDTFIIYKCKISNSRVIEIPLPPEFNTKDVERLTAFLRTQVDDAPE